MYINDEIVIRYLNQEDESTYKNHWIFHSIEEGHYLFETPSYEKSEVIKVLIEQIHLIIRHFEPFNEKVFRSIFRNADRIIADTQILLVVGCPTPYDAMVRKYQENEYIVFDLVRFAEYINSRYNMEHIIRQLLTHELAHSCLHEKYQLQEGATYAEQLNYITFDEGFAHLLAYKEDVTSYDFNTSQYESMYCRSKQKLQEALLEQDADLQKEWFLKANAGDYWDKFAAICGKLYLVKHLDRVIDLYEAGWQGFMK